jgi:hypothetical protein
MTTLSNAVLMSAVSAVRFDVWIVDRTGSTTFHCEWNHVHSAWATASFVNHLLTNETGLSCEPSLSLHCTRWPDVIYIEMIMHSEMAWAVWHISTLSAIHLWLSQVTSCALQSSTPLWAILQWFLALFEMPKLFVHSSQTSGLVPVGLVIMS